VPRPSTLADRYDEETEMRTVVLAMMTTLNGRLDDPGAWVTSIADDQYAEIEAGFDGFDTILVGSTTYAEMLAYWPAAETSDEGFAGANAEINRRVAHKMNTYPKFVFTKSHEKRPLEWANAEQILAHTDDDIVAFTETLRQQPGRDIHLAGGAAVGGRFIIDSSRALRCTGS
jgi:dihydrofolate reductase